MESGDDGHVALMFALGALFLVCAAVLAALRLLFRARAKRVTGMVVAHRHGRKTDGVARTAPVVEYQVGGRTLRHASGLFGTGAPSIGEQVQLFLHPDDPEIVELQGWSSSWTVARVLGFIGLVVTLLALSL